MALEAATYLASLNASNPVGSTDQKSQGDDHLRLIKSALKNSFPGTTKATFIQQARADVASATISVDVPAATSDFLRVTGGTAITTLGTMEAGTKKSLVFSGELVLTHNDTAFILPTAANITTVSNDRAEFISLGSGNWFCTSYTRASGKAIIPPAQSELSFGTLLAAFMTPGISMIWEGPLSTVPNGWLPKDGRAISRTDYATLFTNIGVTHGVGNGSTTFNIPDDRGYVIAGMDDMGTAAGAAGVVTATEADSLNGEFGAETHTLTEDEMPSHTHTEEGVGSASLQGGAGSFQASATSQNTGSAGGDDPHNNMQPTKFRIPIIWTGVLV